MRGGLSYKYAVSSLARRLGFVSLIFYGIGDILGAGIYALVGKVIGLAGSGAWLTFVLAAVAAVLTGISYAELTSRFPVSAGAAAYIGRAFRGRLMPTLAGVFVLGSGLVSAATVTSAFGGYLQELILIPDFLAKLALASLMAFLSFWGIQESSRFNVLLTLVEVAGLLAVIAVGVYLTEPAAAAAWITKSLEQVDYSGILAGVTVAFYAFIGFEDLSNLAEEAKDPKRDLPRAILIAISVSTVVYLLVTLALQLNVSATEVAASKTPLLLVFEKAGYGVALKYFSVVAILAITNTGLVNLIMASRLTYGMSRVGLFPAWFGIVHPSRQTPWVGVLLAYLILLLLVFTGGVKVLAQTTSLLILTVFLLVHLSLIRVKLRKDPHDGISFSIVFPFLGLALTLVLLTAFPREAYLRSLIWPALGFGIWALIRARGVPKH